MDPTQSSSNQTQQPVQPQPVVQKPQQPVVSPVGGKKEAVTAVPTEWVSQSTPEKIVLPKEVEQAGVEVTPTTPPLLPSAQQAGVMHAKEATPVVPVAAEPLGLKTQRSVLSQLEKAHKSWKDGFSWLVRLIIKEQDKEKKGPLV